tara:strand:+ start:343 stop:537 length:195 start_codon:yes stop_codon:yes gene_type:complete
MLANSLNHYTQNGLIQETVRDIIQKSFPIVAGNKRLELTDVYVKDTLESDNFPEQKEFKLNRKT